MPRLSKPSEEELAAALTAAGVSGSPTDQARLATVARACATACLRVADAELGEVAEGAPAPDAPSHLTRTNDQAGHPPGQ